MEQQPKKRGPRKISNTPQQIETYNIVREYHSMHYSMKIEAIKTGISKQFLLQLKDLFSLDFDTLSPLLGITTRAVHLYKGDAIFGKTISDRIIAIADVYSTGYYVFGSREGFHSWLLEPSKELGNEIPLALLDTIIGIQEVKEELHRIEHFIL